MPAERAAPSGPAAAGSANKSFCLEKGAPHPLVLPDANSKASESVFQEQQLTIPARIANSCRNLLISPDFIFTIILTIPMDNFERFPEEEPADPRPQNSEPGKPAGQTKAFENITQAPHERALHRLDHNAPPPFAPDSRFGDVMLSVDEALLAEAAEKADLRKMYPEVLGDEDFTLTSWRGPAEYPPTTKKDFLKVFGLNSQAAGDKLK